MKRHFIISLLTIFTLASCDKDDDLCLIGSGQANDYPLELASFSGVSLAGPINLRITQGEPQETVVVAEPEMFQELTYKVNNGMLEIGFENDVTCFETELGVWVNVTTPNINRVFVTGVSEIVSDGPLDIDDLEINAEGTCDVSLSGSVTNQELISSGVLTVQNFEFESSSTEINISGVGDISINCQDNLDIRISGAATIRYKGNPTITQNVSGSLDLINSN